jgi:hypothetical protein
MTIGIDLGDVRSHYCTLSPTACQYTRMCGVVRGSSKGPIGEQICAFGSVRSRSVSCNFS